MDWIGLIGVAVLVAGSMVMIVTGISEHRRQRYDWIHSVRKGVAAAKDDVKLWGIPNWRGEEQPGLNRLSWISEERIAYERLYPRLLKEYKATLDFDTLKSKQAIHEENKVLRRSKDPSTTRELMMLRKEVARTAQRLIEIEEGR